MHAAMKTFAERNPIVIGLLGIAVTLGVVLAALNYGKLPFVNSNRQYSAYFAEAGGLLTGAAVQVSGFKSGQVNSIELDGARVRVTFEVDKHIRLGDRTEAAIKTKSVLGAKILEVTPRGEGSQSGPIPLERTTSPYQLPDALGDLTTTISGLDTERLSQSWTMLADEFAGTPSVLQGALEGMARFSQTIDRRDADLRALLVDANKVTTVLAERSDAIVTMLTDSNALLADLTAQSRALDTISGDITAMSRQIKGLIAENRQTLTPALNKLDQLLTIVDRPIIDYAVQEAIEAGCETLIFITGRHKRAIEDYFDKDRELEAELRAKVKADGGMRQISYAEAIQEALREEMTRDADVFIMGEDVGLYGGAYGATRNLFQEFGEWRVIDTPISEATIGGAAVGARAGAGAVAAGSAGAGWAGAGWACVLRTYCLAGAADPLLIAASAAGIEMSIRVSMRSMRCSSADSVSLAEGSSSRAHTTSSSSRGAVAPRISPNPACTTSA